MRIRLVLALSAFAFGMTAAIAQQDAVKARKDVMETFSKPYYGDLRKMVRGQEPYDQAKADAGFAVFVAESKKLAPAFATKALPATKSDYDASPKIWDNKADFDAKAANFVKVANDHQHAAKDLDTLKAAYQNITKACDACHDDYRVRNK
jgi:cytochrome c556